MRTPAFSKRKQGLFDRLGLIAHEPFSPVGAFSAVSLSRIAVKSGFHAVGHLVIHAVVKTVERGINDKDVRIEFDIGRQIFPQQHYHHGVQIRMIALAAARSLVLTVDLNIKGI